MELQFEGQVKLSDWLKIALRNFLFAYLFILGILTVIILITFVIGDSSVCQILPFVFLGIVFSIIIISLMVLISVHQLKMEKVFDPLSGTVTYDGINIRQIDAESIISWKRYYKYKRYSTTFLLYTSPYAFQIIPKHLFKSDTDWELFANLVGTNIPKKKIGR